MTATQEQKPKVGVGVMIFKDGKVLLSRRKNSHGEGEYSFPGGHLEYMESFEDCARREVREECGIEIKNIKFEYVSNTKRYAPRHYVHIGLIADWASGEPKMMEPEKVMDEWKWYNINNLPRPLFKLCEVAFNSLKEKKTYYDNLT